MQNAQKQLLMVAWNQIGVFNAKPQWKYPTSVWNGFNQLHSKRRLIVMRYQIADTHWIECSLALQFSYVLHYGADFYMIGNEKGRKQTRVPCLLDVIPEYLRLWDSWQIWEWNWQISQSLTKTLVLPWYEKHFKTVINAAQHCSINSYWFLEAFRLFDVYQSNILLSWIKPEKFKPICPLSRHDNFGTTVGCVCSSLGVYPRLEPSQDRISYPWESWL